MLLHADRYSTSGVQLVKHGVVVHDSESGDGSAQALVAALQRKGDRPRSNGGVYGSGYHSVTDGNGGYIEVADATAGPYHAPPLNRSWWAICMPGRAAQTRDEWLDPLSRNHIRGVARFIVDKAAVDGFPFHKLTTSELLAGDRGYCAHWDVSSAWGQTDHTDPGKSFPWDVLAADIEALTAPIPVPPPIVEDDDMPKTIFVGVDGEPGQYLWTQGSDPIAFTDPHQRDLLLGALGIDPADGVTLSPEMFARLH